MKEICQLLLNFFSSVVSVVMNLSLSCQRDGTIANGAKANANMLLYVFQTQTTQSIENTIYTNTYKHTTIASVNCIH